MLAKKTEYEIESSLVGSEMCIRDSTHTHMHACTCILQACKSTCSSIIVQSHYLSMGNLGDNSSVSSITLLPCVELTLTLLAELVYYLVLNLH